MNREKHIKEDSEMLTVTKENFKAEVEQASKPVLVDLWASWWPYCLKLAPILDELEAKVGDKLTIGKINTDEQPDLAMLLQADVIPTLYVFKGGQRSEKLIAPSSLEQLEGWLKEQKVL